ncbi:hypothetical protein ABLE94_21865 [Gordonia sp. VNK1]|uniref:hypothetical protein n=1 Tax=Gordonia oleivorans TaxID=3156618 RepID=UPI0032B38101
MPEMLHAIRIRHSADIPEAFRHHQISLPRHDGVDAQAVVVDLDESDDADRLRLAAVRHWWSADHSRLPRRVGRMTELSEEHSPALNVADLGLIDPALVAEPGCPVTTPGADVRRTWVAATRYRVTESDRPPQKRCGWVPYTLAFARGWDTKPAEPEDHPPFLSGLGAGLTHAAAVDDAWAALAVEDALWRWWAAEQPEVIETASAMHPEVSDLLGPAPGPVTLQVLPARLGGVVTLAAVDDGEIIALGGGYGNDARAQRSAIARAFWQLVVARSLSDAGSAMYRAGTSGLPAHRTDRGYLAASGPRHRTLLDPIAHVQLLIDPVVRNLIRDRLDAPARLDDRKTATDSGGRVAALSTPPHDVAWRIDLSPPDNPSGVCVRPLVPGTATIPLGAFPPDAVVTATPSGVTPYPGW